MNDWFEGYVGIPLWDGQVLNDLLFTLILSVLLLFALIFRLNYRACIKMFKDVVSIKERQNIFEKKVASDFYFRLFMMFQTLFLCTIFVFSYLYVKGYLTFELTSSSILICIATLFGITLLFFFFKWFLYSLTGVIFSDTMKYRIWKNSYIAIMGTWGIFLYVPIAWFALWGKFPTIPIVLFVFSYILCRFAIIDKTLRIFHRKNTGLLYISLYLCTQEILPLVFLYEGMVYLYNFIKTSTLWH